MWQQLFKSDNTPPSSSPSSSPLSLFSFVLNGKSPSMWLVEWSMFGLTLERRVWVASFLVIGALVTTSINVFNVIQFYSNAEARKSPRFQSVLLHLLPLIVLTGGSYTWALFSPQQVFLRHPHQFMLTVGFLAAFVVGRLVLARVCDVPFPPFIPQLAGYPIALLNAVYFRGTLFDETTFLYCYMVFAILNYFYFA